jgi:hypothetical protein
MGGSHSQSDILDVINTNVANVITNISLNCQVDSTSLNAITINCNLGPFKPDGESYADNPTCKTAIQTQIDTQLRFYDQATAYFDRDGTGRLPSIHEDLYPMFMNLIALGTTGACKACSISNYTQSLDVSANGSCDVTNQITNVLDQQITSTVDQTLTNNEDFLSSIAQAFGMSTRSDVVTSLSNRVSQLLTTDIVQKAVETIQANNTATFVGVFNDNQPVIQNQVQSAAMNFLQTNNVMNNLFTAREMTVIQDSLNDQNTIGTLGNLTYKTIDDFDKMLTSQVGKVVLFVWAILIVLIAFLLVFLVVKLTKKGWAEAEQRKSLKELDANRPVAAF